MTLRFHKFEPSSELPAQRELFRESFPEAVGLPPETRAFYEWKFHSFPDPVPSYEYVAANSDGKMAGYYAALPFSYQIDNKILRCGMVCDVMTSIAMRGKGVFTALGRHSLQQLSEAKVDFVLGYPIRPEVIPGHIKVGWKIAFKMPMYLFPLGVKSLLSSRGIPWAAPVFSVVLLAWHFLFALLNTGGKKLETQVLTINELLALKDFDEFIKKWMAITPHALVKSKQFLKWRLGAPGSEYSALCVRNFQGEIAQIAIVRSAPLKGVPALCILDWMTLEKNRSSSNSCHRALREFARLKGCEVIVAMMSRIQARKLNILALGFFPTPAVFSLILNNLSGTVPESKLLDEKNWALMWIDSDDL